MLIRCAGCAERPKDKLVQVTWAWRRTDGVRKAYRSRLCHVCFAAQVAPLQVDYEGVERLTCPKCGIDTEDDMDALYVTAFIAGYGPLRLESPFCPSCAAHARVWILDHSQELEDQLGATGGPQPDVATEEMLRGLGIDPSLLPPR